MSIQHLIYVSGANAARGAIVAISLLVIVASLQGFNLPGNREGYEPVQFDVMITPGETVTYKGELKRVQ